MYKSIIDIDKTDLFIYAVLIIVIAVIVTRISPSGTLVIGVVVGLIVVYFLNDKQVVEQGSYVQRIINILQAPRLHIRRNSALYKDPLIVEFLETYKEYYDYNPQAYVSLTNLLNNLLQLGDDIDNGSKNYSSDYEIMLDTKSKILNTYHSILYKVPHDQTSLLKFHNGTKTLKHLVNELLDKANRHNLERTETEGINTTTRFHYKAHPKPTDPDWNQASYHS